MACTAGGIFRFYGGGEVFAFTADGLWRNCLTCPTRSYLNPVKSYARLRSSIDWYHQQWVISIKKKMVCGRGGFPYPATLLFFSCNDCRYDAGVNKFSYILSQPPVVEAGLSRNSCNYRLRLLVGRDARIKVCWKLHKDFDAGIMERR